MRILAALGRSARMSPAESADVVIEMDAVKGELGPDFADRIACVSGSAGEAGAPGDGPSSETLEVAER